MASTNADFWETYTFPKVVSFDVNDSGLLFSSKWLEPKSASCIAREDLNFDQSDTEYTLFLTHNDRRFDTSESVIRKFCSKWNLPASTQKWLTFWCRFDTVYSEPVGTLMCIWYELVVPRAGSVQIESNESLRACHMIDDKSRISRTVVICSREMEAKVRVSRQLHAHLTGNGRAAQAQIQPGWFTVHLIIASAVEFEIAREHFSRIQSFVTIAHGQAIRSIDGTFDTECLKNCNRALALTDNFDDGIELVKRVLTHLGPRPNQGRMYKLPKCRVIEHRIQNVINDLESTLRISGHYRRTLINVRHTLLHAMDIRNATLVRQNTTALRRIAYDLRNDSISSEKQAEISGKNTVLATRIAILTLIFLPSTFMATVFSTPFFQLDDNLRFKALSKIWWYILFSVITTLVTITAFAISIPGWNPLPRLFCKASLPKLDQMAARDGGEDPDRPGKLLFEPPPFITPASADIELEIIGEFRRRRRTGESGNEAETDSPI